MQHRKPLAHESYRPDPYWERSTEFRDLVSLLSTDWGAWLPRHLTGPQRVAVEAKAAMIRWPNRRLTRGDYRAALERAMKETGLRVAAPKSDTPTLDLIEAWRQPEAKRLWQRILEPKVKLRSSIPSLHFALGVMLVAGGLRLTPHILGAHDFLAGNEPAFSLVCELANSCDGPLQREPVRRSYGQVTRRLAALSEGLAAEVQITLGEIAAEFSSWGLPVGRYLAVDGSFVPAWTQQRPGTTPALEARLRRRTPEAGYVVHTRESTFSDGRRTRSIIKEARGYGLTTLVDLATGLVLALDLRDLTRANEPQILREVLVPRLFDVSPNLEVEAIVGDGAYDDNPTHEHLLTRFGINLVASRGQAAFKRRGLLLTEAQHPSVAAVQGDGIALCRAHRLPLEYRGLEPTRRINRAGLSPGELRDGAAFRSRFECPEGCGRVSVPTRYCWSNLPFYPHTPHGRLDLYAFRRALLVRRSLIESSFSSLQVGYKQSLDGAARSRVFDRTVNEALIALSFVTRALLALHAERMHRGECIAA